MNKKKGLIIAAAIIALVAIIAIFGGSKEETQINSKNATELAIGTLNTVENYAELTLFKVRTTDKITASLDDGLYYENQSPDEVYIDMIFDIKNISAVDIGSNDFMTVKASGADGSEYVCNLYAVETDNYSYVSQFENIAPLTSIRFHSAISVPKTETELDVVVTVNGEKYSYHYVVGNVERNATALKKGDVIEVEDFATLTFKGIAYTDDLLPSNTNGVYSHYEVDNNDNTYLVVKYDIENLQSSAKKVDTFLGVKAVYMGKYTYTGFVVVEDSDKKGFSSYESIDPLTKRSCYCLIEVPKSVSTEEVELDISFNSQDYIFKG